MSSEATYTAWDDNSYPWPPPDGWYQAGDGKWWPEGYGPQEEDLLDGAASSDGSAPETALDATAMSSGPGTSQVGSTPDTSAGYSSASAVEAPSARTSSSEIFERMQSDASQRSGQPWSASEAVTEAPTLTGDSAGSVLDRASDSASSALESGSSGIANAADSASSTVSETTDGFVERRASGFAAGAGASAAALGAAAYSASRGSETPEADLAPQVGGQDVASAEYTDSYSSDQGAPDFAASGDLSEHAAPAASEYTSADQGAADYSAPDYSAPDYSSTDYSASNGGVVDQVASDYADAPVESPTVETASDLGQPIPGQELPPDYSDGFSSSYTQGSSYSEPGYTEQSLEVGQAAVSAETASTDEPPSAGFETPAANGTEHLNVGADAHTVIDQPIGQQPVAEAAPGGSAPWDDPSVDTAVNPIVRADDPNDVAQGMAAPANDGRIGSPDAGRDPFGSAPASGAAFDDGRFASYDNRGQVNQRQSPGPLLAPPVRDQPKGGRGRGLMMSLVVLAALALAGLAGYFFYQQQQGDDGAADVAASDSGDAAPGSLTNPHDSSRAVQIEYTAEDVAQVWTIQATASAQTDLGSSTEIQADLTLANGNVDGQAALADLVVSIVDADGEVLASGASDCTNTQAMSWGQSVAGGASVSGPVCWVIPTESVDGALLGIESTKAQGRIHIRLPE